MLHEVVKKVCTGVYTGIFRQFTPKITGLFCVHFLCRDTSGCYVTGTYDLLFHKNSVFFRMHPLYEATKNVCRSVLTNNFQHVLPKNHCFVPRSFLHRCTVCGIYHGYTTYISMKALFSSVCTRCARVYKIYTSVYIPAFFDSSALKIHVFLRAHFCTGCISRSYVCTCKSFLINQYVFFRIHNLHDAMKSVYVCVYTDIFQNGEYIIICFTPCLLFTRVHIHMISRVQYKHFCMCSSLFSLIL